MAARSISHIILRGSSRLPAARLINTAQVPVVQRGIRSFTSLPKDPDTLEDFQPTNKTESSDVSLTNIVEQDVKENPVMIYDKGVPELPRCDYCSLAVRILNAYNVPFSARNILEDLELKIAVKSHSNWPTFPQIFIMGEFVGGTHTLLDTAPAVTVNGVVLSLQICSLQRPHIC